MTALSERFRPAGLPFLLVALAGLAVFVAPFLAPGPVQGQQARLTLLALSGAAGLLLLALLTEAQQGLTAHTVAMLGALVGLNTALRVVENVIPLPGGFSPVFLLIILVGHIFGARLGFLMGALTMLVSGPLTAGGLGPWTPFQMLAAGWVGLGAVALPRGRLAFPALLLYGALWGWLYGAFTDLYFWPYALLAPDLAWEPGLGPLEALSRFGRFYLVTSLAWDTMRALGNVVLLALLGRPLARALERFHRRAYVSWEPG